MIKGVGVLWVAGSGQGGLDMGEIGTNPIVVYIWAVADSSGQKSDDILFSKSGLSPQLPPGYDLKRLLGGRPWRGSVWHRFYSFGNGLDRWTYFIENRFGKQISNPVNSAWSGPIEVTEAVPSVTAKLLNLSLHANHGGDRSFQMKARWRSDDPNGIEVYLNTDTKSVNIGGTNQRDSAIVPIDETGSIWLRPSSDLDVVATVGIDVNGYMETL
jgi:hypothetical protein